LDVKQFSSDKILAHLDRINEWQEKGISRAITFELDMTNICNQKCPRCFGFDNQIQHRESLSLTAAKDIVKQIKDIGGLGLTFTGGGEPLCNPATGQVVQYAKKIGLDIGFITNGYSLNVKISELLVRNCTWIRISLDADTPEIYKLTHGMDAKAFNKVIENIKLLVMKKKLNPDCTIGIGYLTSRETKKGIYNMALLGKKLGVDYVQYRPLLREFGGKIINYDSAIQKQIIKQIEKSIALSDDSINILYSKHKYESMLHGKEFREYDICYGHNFAAVVCADKKMYICCHFRGVNKYCIGDLSKDSLHKIWNSAQRKRVYENINMKECVPLCRCNTFNTILWNIKQKKVHKNFI